MRSKNTLIAMAGVVEGFPVTAEQIKKYHKINPAFIIGTMKKRQVKSSQFASKDASSDPEPVREDKMKPDHPSVEANNHDVVDGNMRRVGDRFNIIGFRVGADIVGFHEKTALLLMVDQASMLTMVEKPVGVKQKVDECADQIAAKFSRHDEPIQNIISDSDIILVGRPMEAVFRKHNIKTASASLPGQQAYNGLCEHAHYMIGCICIALLVSATHLTYAFWIGAYRQGSRIMNMAPSPMIGKEHMSREETLTKVRFDCLVVIMMPFGQPLLFFIDKERRTPDNWAKAAVGIYVGPAFDNITGQGVPGGILVFSYKSKRVRTVVTWKTLDKPPSP
jgi:hypothetical protein